MLGPVTQEEAKMRSSMMAGPPLGAPLGEGDRWGSRQLSGPMGSGRMDRGGDMRGPPHDRERGLGRQQSGRRGGEWPWVVGRQRVGRAGWAPPGQRHAGRQGAGCAASSLFCAACDNQQAGALP